MKYKVIKKRPGGPEVGEEYTRLNQKEGKIKIGKGGEDTEYLVEKELVNEYLEPVKESKVPDSWESLEIKTGRYIDDFSKIEEYESMQHLETAKNVVPTKEHAEAILALCQLLQLRNKTRENCGNWKPDRNDNSMKYTIHFVEEKINQSWTNCEILSFPTREVRDEFLEKHRNLIEKLLPLYS